MKNSSQSIVFDVETIARAIFIVNRHTKSAIDPRSLYHLKQRSLQKLLKDKKAKKIGIHTFTGKRCVQTSSVLVQVGDYCFHIPPTKDDFQQLKNLGRMDGMHRNPKVSNFSLTKAKSILYSYLGETEMQKNTKKSSSFISTYLGKK